MATANPPTSSNSFRFGQIVYVLSPQSKKIFPAIIEQEIINRRLDGEKVSYIVQMGAPGKARSVNLDKIDGEVFGAMEDVRARLEQELEIFVKNFNDNIDKLCEEANTMANKWYGEQLQQLNNNNNGGTGGSDPSKIDPAAFIAEQQYQQPQYYNPNQQQLMHNSQQMMVPGNQLYIPQHQPVMPMSNTPQDHALALRQTLYNRVVVPDDNDLSGMQVEVSPGKFLPVRQSKPNQQD